MLCGVVIYGLYIVVGEGLRIIKVVSGLRDDSIWLDGVFLLLLGDEFSGYGKIVKETLQSLSYFKGCNEIKKCVS